MLVSSALASGPFSEVTPCRGHVRTSKEDILLRRAASATYRSGATDGKWNVHFAPPADPEKNHGTVAPDGTVPVVTNVMVTAGISQLPRIDWPLAEITEALRRVYRVMWKLRGVGTP
jgi:hypothetical protein